jgi:hypothetical protein
MTKFNNPFIRVFSLEEKFIRLSLGREIFLEESAELLFQRGRCFQEADAFIGQAVNNKIVAFGFEDSGNHEQVFFAVNAQIGFFAKGFFDGVPTFFLDGPGFVGDAFGARNLVTEIFALDLAVEDLNIRF